MLHVLYLFYYLLDLKMGKVYQNKSTVYFFQMAIAGAAFSFDLNSYHRQWNLSKALSVHHFETLKSGRAKSAIS